MPHGDTIRMNDLHAQYLTIQNEIHDAIADVLNSAAFIDGPHVQRFADRLAAFLNVPYVIPCANGTDALQLAMMALELAPGDEIIIPAFNYISAAEAARLLRLTPAWADVRPDTFNLDIRQAEKALTPRTKAIVPTHLFGQACDMAPILDFAQRHHLYVIEDNAQSLGSLCRFPDGHTQMAGTIGHIGITSFFPSKPLACYGDGGALFTADPQLAERIRMLAHHGQTRKYHHQLIGCNSRLDTLQAAILEVKLNHLDHFNLARTRAAQQYQQELQNLPLRLPQPQPYATHIYSQYTLQIPNGQRDALQAHLQQQGIPSIAYFPVPLHLQEAYRQPPHPSAQHITVATQLANNALSLPIHTQMTPDLIHRITRSLRSFF